jgi:hypothetical protein
VLAPNQTISVSQTRRGSFSSSAKPARCGPERAATAGGCGSLSGATFSARATMRRAASIEGVISAAFNYPTFIDHKLDVMASVMTGKASCGADARSSNGRM